MRNKIKQKRVREKGQVLMLTVLLLSLASSLASFLAGSIILYQVRAASEVASAVVAIFAADGGVQCELYRQLRGPSVSCPPTFTNGATSSSSANVIGSSTIIRSKGIFRDTSRALEASF